MPLPRRPSKGKKKEEPPANPFESWSEELLSEGISSAYAGLTIYTGRDWWSRSPKDCEAAARPLLQWLKTLPPATFARVEQHLPLGAVVMAFWNLTWPALLQEWELIQVRKEARGPQRASAHGDGAGSGGAAAPVADAGEAVAENGRAPGTIHLPKRTAAVPNGNGAAAR